MARKKETLTALAAFITSWALGLIIVAVLAKSFPAAGDELELFLEGGASSSMVTMMVASIAVLVVLIHSLLLKHYSVLLNKTNPLDIARALALSAGAAVASFGSVVLLALLDAGVLVEAAAGSLIWLVVIVLLYPKGMEQIPPVDAGLVPIDGE